MSRNASGTYTLPSGNPVSSGTDITVTWGNNTMNDIATELTDSLSRSGKGGMLAPMLFNDGTESVPGIAWVSDANSGFYRIGADNLAMSLGGTKVIDYADGSFSFIDNAASASVGPIFSIFRDSASPADADLIGDLRFDGEDSAGNKTTYASISSQIDDVTNGTEDGTLLVKSMTAGTLTTQLDVSSALVNITPPTTIAGLTTIASLKGTGAVTITDILDEDNMASNSATKLATQQSIKAYVDSQVDTADTLAEVLAIGNTTGGTDVSVSTDDKVQFRDAAIYINSSVDGQLDIVADTEIQIAATTIDINGAVNASGEIIAASLDISGNIDVDGTSNLDIVDIDGAVDMATTLQVDGVATFTGRDIHSGGITIANAGQIGSVGDTDAIAIASDGVVTLTQKLIGTELDISGDIDVDGTTNLDIVDIDGAVNMATTALVTGVLTTTATQVATGGITSGSDIISDTDGTDSLGSTGVRWLKGWFDTLQAGTLVMGAGSITDTSGAIDFGNENLVTTGTLGSGALTATTIAGTTGDFSRNVTITNVTEAPEFRMIYDEAVVSTNEVLGTWSIYGGEDGGEASVASIVASADGTWTDTSSATSLEFFVTAATEVAGTLALTINSDKTATFASDVTGGTIKSSGAVFTAGKTSKSFGTVGCSFEDGDNHIVSSGEACLAVNRLTNDGNLIELAQGGSVEGTIAVSGSTVSYNGFCGTHESSGVSTDTAVGTVISTIDDLDVYLSGGKSGQTREHHAKIKVSDSVGDVRVYGVIQSFNDDGKSIVASVGIGEVLVTGACSGGDLLVSNGDGTAKVQDDDIIRSKTIGKVTIGDNTVSVSSVPCVLYCG